MSRHIVCLTFDFDAISSFVARGLTTPTPISRGEFGLVGASRILALLRKHDIRSTWFVPGLTITTFPDACAAVVAAGHEIGHHGWTHMLPTDMPAEREEAELVRANEAIEELAGRRARGYRSPAWDLSPRTLDLLLKHGFIYDSSMMGDDYTPYRARTGDIIRETEASTFGPETRIVEMPISWSVDDFPHFEFLRTPQWLMPGLAPAGGVLQNWVDDFEYMTRTLDWGVLTYTCHPYVIGRGHRMMMLERLILALKERGAVFLTMEEAVAEFAARPAAEGAQGRLL